MKRVIAIVAIVLSVGVVVGAFIIGGGDGSTEAKGGSPTTAAANDVKTGAQAIANAGTKVQSEAPAPAASGKGEKGDKGGKVCAADSDDDDDDTYEAKRPFVGVSPSTVRVGKDVEIQARNFTPCDTITITVKNGATVVDSKTFTADKKGRVKAKFVATQISNPTFSVSAAGTDGKSATTTLKVVAKKS